MGDDATILEMVILCSHITKCPIPDTLRAYTLVNFRRHQGQETYYEKECTTFPVFVVVVVFFCFVLFWIIPLI